MDAAFWHERWQRGEIGFHKASTNPLLQRWWPRLGVDAKAQVWVPLCGKSLDLIWLRSQGHPVRGVELARSALESFSDEHGLDLQWQTEGEFEVNLGVRETGFEVCWEGVCFPWASLVLPLKSAVFWLRERLR